MTSYRQAKHQLWIDRVSTPADQGMNRYAWFMAYKQGYRQPNYPVPAIYGIPNFDTYKCHGFWIAQMSDLTAPLERLPVP